MKQRTTTHRTLLRTTQIAVASAAFALLAACGGGGGSSANNTPPAGVNMQVVSFGTSLSDAGTYEPILLGFGGGRFTTNPGEVWTQKVSEYFGNPMTPAFEGGFGSVLSATGGFDYAQGGATVATGGVANPLTTPAPTATEMPLTWQVQQYLAQHGSFNANQLVLVEGGANDILNNVATILGTIVTDILTAQAQGHTPSQTDIAGYVQTATAATLQSSAVAFATVVGQVLSNGAKHVAVVNVPDIGVTPLAQANEQIQTEIGASVSAKLANMGYTTAQISAVVPQIQAQIPALVTGIVQTYNGMVTLALTQGGIADKVVPIDSFSWIESLAANYSAQGFTVGNTGTGCNLSAMATNATQYFTANPTAIPAGSTAASAGQSFASSLFCSASTYTVPGADQSYVFADTIHPTTHTHVVFANFVETQLAAAGIGKAP